MTPGLEALADGVLAQPRPDDHRFGHLERHGQRAGPEHERQILRGGEVLAAHRDLSARADGALDDRRAAHHAVVEHDRHVVA